MRYTSKVLVLALAILVAASDARAEGWTVHKVSGTASVQIAGESAARMTAGMTVPPGTTVQTAPRSRAMLVQDQDTIVLGPSTLIQIPREPAKGLSRSVLQQAGVLDLAV